MSTDVTGPQVADIDKKVRVFLDAIGADLAQGLPVFASDSSESSESSETSENSETTESSEGGESGGSEDNEGSLIIKALLSVDPAGDEWGAIVRQAAPVLQQLQRR